MRIVVLGGTGLIGRRIVDQLSTAGHEVMTASRANGIDTLTGAGLGEAFAGARVVIDATNPARAVDPERFFEASARNIGVACKAAGAGHVIVVSIVGVDGLDAPYQRGKQRQERIIADSGVPFTIARITQFSEFVPTIADASTVDGTVRLPPIFIQPIPVDDAARAITELALGSPVNGIRDIAGPERFRLPELVRVRLAATGDMRRVVSDPAARYFGAAVTEFSLVPRPR
jgi:uncharacterized protein YbjT (DUF2867 family)